ncbi:tyrosine-protein phosphatase [Paeniglutamicibacter psychrophenolicus]|uniref:tyrosine-protein phosphatase n=1 Tax=Paeniglutamicibacter psychrophenolicus TaxID=257454 RepID=UPI0027D833CE|nr:tyrosine-protein phosphatase [Paeniglutamicibacter psychrophenolicus]
MGLRCAYEAGAQATDPVVPAEELAGIAIRQAPTEDHEDPAFREACFPILDSPKCWSHNWLLQPHLVRAALEAIATAAPGVLLHCSAGRDRTGMICALLPGNAGVDPMLVAADYPPPSVPWPVLRTIYPRSTSRPSGHRARSNPGWRTSTRWFGR